MSKAPGKVVPVHGHAPHAAHDDHGDGGGHDDHGGGGHCPPPWIITFADMSVLLMAFFVIMLMAAETDVPKFNAFAATMRQTFGTMPLDPEKGGTSIINLQNGPQSGEQTDDPPKTTPESSDPDAQDLGGPGGAADQAVEALAKAMRDAVANGELTVESDAGEVKVKLPPGASAEDAQEIAEALANAAGTEVSPSPPAGSAAATGAETEADSANVAANEGGGSGEGNGAFKARVASQKLGMVLEEQLANGTVEVERRDGAVVVTVGAGGAFIPGSADLSSEAMAIIEQLQNASGKATRIVVTGHTDSTPLTGGAYKDNWELAAARAASVVREIAASGLVPDVELVATGLGDTKPVADNATEEGRAKNRRIEVEIEFAE